MTNRCWLSRALAALLIATVASSARAEGDDEVLAPTPSNYVIGAGLSLHPDGAGARHYKTTPSLLWAIRWGRWRISAGGANALFGFGREVTGSGASTDLINNKRWRLGVSLRLDSGRKSGDVPATAGLPNIQRTVRGRFFTSYTLSPAWQLSGSLSQDLMGHQGGLLAGLDLGWRWHPSELTQWTADIGLGAADGQNMRSYFGVTPAGAQRSGLPAFMPSAGLRDVHAGIGFTHALSPRWVTFGSVGFNRLIGDAAKSPLTLSPTGAQIGVGLAYRN